MTDRTRRRLFQLGAVLTLAVALVLVAIVVSGGDDRGVPGKRTGEVVAGQTEVREMLAGIPQSGITLGDPKAKVTVVEFADLQCPFCREFAQQTLPLLVRDYVRSGQAKIEFRSLSFIGDDSVRAARFADGAAQQDKLWNVVDLFYFNQGPENSGYATDQFLRKLGRAVPGFDADAALRHDGRRALADADALARREGVDSTPTLLVAGERVDGFDYGAVKAAIDEALKA